jgi:DNA-binding response OmpR family regulator
MAKLLLVEDDINLRDIYATRLQAEGYQVVTASDGEEALAVAVKEKPDLVLCDIMMPKISGFDVLDILRSTPETKHAKIVMMTALSQQSDRERGERLGADKYLVKSQVTLEDVVNTVHEQLGQADAAVSQVVNDNLSQGSNNKSGSAAAVINKEGINMNPDETTPADGDDNQVPGGADTGAPAPGGDTGGAPAPDAGGDGGAAPAEPPVPSTPPAETPDAPADDGAADSSSPQPGETVSPGGDDKPGDVAL